MQDKSLIEDLNPIASSWWLISILIIAGGLMGWLISLVKPPLYEARASLVIILDANDWNLVSKFQRDTLPRNINPLISPQVLGEGLIGEYNHLCNNITTADLYVERSENEWDLVVRCSDPQAAADLANAWANSAIEVLAERYEHSLNTEALSLMLNILENCQEDPSDRFCAGISEIQILRDRIFELRDELGEERLASQGITPAISFSILSYAAAPTKPVFLNTGIMIFAGMVTGLITSILVVTTIKGKIPNKHK